ncbi:MAG TPA: S-layer homology domain-containing protein [Chloroflexia bacterium]|jgi:hypothetical protein|nr:S-layer homology domain-containing protein [Chloroflexia bacterium]
MNRKLTALLVAFAAAVGLLGSLLAGAPVVRADVFSVTDTTTSDFQQGSFFHTELAPAIDDGSVDLQAVGLAGSWHSTVSTGLPPRFYHTSARVGNFIYTCGGQANNQAPPTLLASCYMASIDVNGGHGLSAWTAVSSLPQALAAPASAVVGNTIYVMGGVVVIGGITQQSNVIYRATVNTTTGQLSAWTTDTQTLPFRLSHFGAAGLNGRIYIVGGAGNNGIYYNKVYFSTPGGGGGLSAWTETTPLPGVYAGGVNDHIVMGYTQDGVSRLFVATGQTNAGSSSVADVYSAAVNSAGNLSTWVANTSYQRPLSSAAGVAYGCAGGGNLFISGGATNNTPTDLTNYVAATLLDGPPNFTATGWYETTALDVARFAHTMVASADGWLYVIDGADATGAPLDSVRFGQTACGAGGGPTRAPSGIFTSRPIDLGTPYDLLSMSANSSIAPGVPVTMTLTYRVSDNQNFVENGQPVPFTRTFTLASGITHTQEITLTEFGRYFQYQVEMSRAETALTRTPVLNWVKVLYQIPIPPPTATPGVIGVNLVASSLEVTPFGGARPSMDHPIQFNMRVRNEGTVAVPPGSPLESDIFTHLTRPPGSGDTSDTFGRVVLSAPLQPGQEIVVPSAPIMPSATGVFTMYGWVNRNGYIQDSNHADDIIGPTIGCISRTDGQSFLDVFLQDYYYTPVEYLACRGVISGYDAGNGTYNFRPGNNTTRGQFAKMVTLSMGWPLLNPTTPTFRDVAPGSVFYQYIETAVNHGVISGYTCGTGCLEYRPGNNITRGQLAKIIALAKGWALLDPPTAHFRDVPPGSVFYQHIETVVAKGVVSGYTCGTGCLEYRPGNNGTRGQLSKMLYFAVTQR